MNARLRMPTVTATGMRMPLPTWAEWLLFLLFVVFPTH